MLLVFEDIRGHARKGWTPCIRKTGVSYLVVRNDSCHESGPLAANPDILILDDSLSLPLMQTEHLIVA